MADVFTRIKRAEIMASVRGRGNKATEGALVEILRKNHITGWRRHPKLFGNPDFVFREHRLAIFVDGCFWHDCPKHSSQPLTNHAFWKKKLQMNKKRDRLVTRTLRQRGWRVLRVWQHELSKRVEARCVERVRKYLCP
jgi:DNA mismatch endonuclease, patch repair protein